LVNCTKQKKEEHIYLQSKLTVLNESKSKMQHLEHDYWRMYGQICSQREALHMEMQSLTCRLDYAFDRLERARRTYILNDTFHVWYASHFGTINGYRLGRLTSQPVEYSEVNAAWGMTAMLVDLMAKVLDYEFVEVRILPMGSQTKVGITKDNTEYELYSDRDGPFRFLWAHRYDRAMSGILDCVRQLVTFVSTMDPDFKAPYEIVDERIGLQSVKLQFNAEDKWTKALKFMLTNIKFLIAWMAGRMLQLRPTSKVTAKNSL